ncbi:MAG: hypothetical protein KDA96_24725, partial [Planctomycetaceae bacterium]|nr:hypothetical protein [Planctomycetaceae bacterium]
VPFRELQKVFDNQQASVVIPYAEYMDLLKKYLEQQHANGTSPDAVLNETSYAAVVEQDVARITATLKLNVLKQEGWASIPLSFGPAAIGAITPDDGTVLLKGAGQGRYELLVRGSGERTISLELLANVQTSPDSKSFAIECPPAGICHLTATVPEADQDITVAPLQVRLPLEQPAAEGSTAARFSLGAVERFHVKWNSRAGTKPVMDLLTSADNQSKVHITPGLIETESVISYEVLRGELREVAVLVPADAGIIDVLSSNGRNVTWNVQPSGETHQIIRAELLSPVSDRFTITVRTERKTESDIISLLGRDGGGKLQGVHADGVVRESGRLTLSLDPTLTTVIQTQSGVRQVDTGAAAKGNSVQAQQAWEFSGTTGQLVVQVKPIEPRLLVEQDQRLVFSDDELRLTSQLTYTIERAGVFQLQIQFPESLTIDTVRADGMRESTTDRENGIITLSLAKKETGKLVIDVTAHQAFDANAENLETELPTLTPLNVERDTGTVSVFAPRFLDVSTVDEKLAGLFPAQGGRIRAVGLAPQVAAWNYTRRPIAAFVRTSPRPAQIAASVATTANVEPEIIKVNSVVTFDIQNAGIDTFRIAVPESVASDVRFEAASASHTIQQRTKGDAVDGWVTWTLVLPSEVTGQVRISVDWEQKPTAGDSAAEDTAGADNAAADATTDTNASEATAEDQSFELHPPRVLPPFDDAQADRRKVTLTQVRGEMRVLRDESLSVTTASSDDL